MKSLIRQTAFPEAYLWILGLLFLGIAAPEGEWTICPLSNLGFEHCPGCGLGRSVSLLLRGEFRASWDMHPLGGMALIILIARSIYLFINNSTIKSHNSYGKSY